MKENEIISGHIIIRITIKTIKCPRLFGKTSRDYVVYLAFIYLIFKKTGVLYYMYSEEKSADNELLPKTFTDYRGKQVEINWPKGQLLCKVGDVRLFHQKQEAGLCARYAVVYGLQVREGLNYSEACDEMGESIMHNMICDYGQEIL